MSAQESKDHSIGERLAKQLKFPFVGDSRSLYNTPWGPRTPIGITRILRILTKQQ
jgi:hypothetical protein